MPESTLLRLVLVARSLACLALAALLAIGCKSSSEEAPGGSTEAPAEEEAASDDAAPVEATEVERAEIEVPERGGVDEASTTITHVAPSVGLAIEKRATLDMKANIATAAREQGAQQSALDSHREVERRVKILEVGERGPTRVEITYSTARERRAFGGKELVKEHAVEGKTYLVEMRGDKIGVSAPDESSVPPAEGQIVASEFDDLAKSDKLAAVFPAGELTPGQKLEVTPELMNQALSAGSETGQVQAVEMTYLGTRQVDEHTVAVFDVDVTIGGEPMPGASLSATLEGEMTVRPDTGWVESVDLAGDVDISGQMGPDAAIDGKGQMRMVEQSKFTMP